jgi:hypothetical protein
VFAHASVCGWRFHAGGLTNVSVAPSIYAIKPFLLVERCRFFVVEYSHLSGINDGCWWVGIEVWYPLILYIRINEKMQVEMGKYLDSFC